MYQAQGNKKYTQNFSSETWSDHLDELGVAWRIILKYMLNSVRGCGLDLPGSGHGPMAGSCGYNNKHSGNFKGCEFQEQLSDY